MSIRVYVALLLAFSFIATVGLSAWVAMTLHKERVAAESSGLASSHFKDVQSLVATSSDLFGVLDVLTSHPSNLVVIAKRSIERCRKILRQIRDSSSESEFQRIDRLIESFERMVVVAEKAAGTAGPSDDKEAALVQYDAHAAIVVGLIADLEDHAKTVAQRELLELENQYGRDHVAMVVSAIVLIVALVGLHRWITVKLVNPVQDLAGDATDALNNNEPFSSLERGPTELRKLHRAIGSFINTLEEKVHARTEELQDAESRIRALLDGSPVCIKIIDLEFRLSYMSGAGQEQLKIPDISVYYGRTYPEFFPESMQSRVVEHLERAKTGETCNIESPVLDSEGNELWFDITFSPGRDKTGQIAYIIASSVEITDRKRAEAEQLDLETQLRHSQKMEAVGQLAGGVAHDFNNILTAIVGHAEQGISSVHRELGSNSDLKESMEEIQKAAGRAASLTRQLLTFSRQDVVQPAVINVNSVLVDLRGMLQRLVPKSISFSTVTDPGLRSVHMDASQLEQVIVNLVVNAADAMPDGGRLNLETRNVVIDDEYARLHFESAPGQYVLLSVSDTGLGMDDATRERIFEPFFTTKSVGKGTGLGLATVYGIVQQSRGRIEVDSEKGCGSTFKVYLPSAGAEPELQVSGAEVESESNGDETILLCEDDATVCELTAQSLKHAGYKVFAAGSGTEGLSIAKSHASRIDLLVTDVMMPDMSGRELSERLHAFIPDLPVLFISGYSAKFIANQGVLDTDVEFLEKPFTRQSILAKIRAVLGHARSDA